MAVVPYTDNVTTTLTSPKQTLPATSTVQVGWWDRRDTEPCCDHMSLKWSSDGVHWSTAWSAAGQNGLYPQFSEESAQFVAPKGPLYLQFVMASDGGVSSPPYTGVTVADVSVSR
jgi:hypothetical protein